MPQISVVLPVYNVEEYLRQCLDSLANQTFEDFEVICVNDGSGDSSLSILEEYASEDERFKIISQENKGLSGARNTGMDRIVADNDIGYVIDYNKESFQNILNHIVSSSLCQT